jgi:hypothetical protein
MVSEVALQRPAYSPLVTLIAPREPSEPYQALDPAFAQRDREAPSALPLTLSVEAHALGASRSIRLFFCGRRLASWCYTLSHRERLVEELVSHPF